MPKQDLHSEYDAERIQKGYSELNEGMNLLWP